MQDYYREGIESVRYFFRRVRLSGGKAVARRWSVLRFALGPHQSTLRGAKSATHNSIGRKADTLGDLLFAVL